MFRVVPDQLRISEGWVRCGHCEGIFDATVHMVTGLPGTREALEVSGPGVADSRVSDDYAATVPLALDTPVTEQMPLRPWTTESDIKVDSDEARRFQERFAKRNALGAPGANSPAQEAAAVGDKDGARAGKETAPSASHGSLPTSAVSLRQNHANDAQNGPLRELLVAGKSNGTPSSSPEDWVEAQDLSFMRSRMPSVKEQPGSVALWGGAALALVFALAGQGMFRERDRIAASVAQTRPLLAQACEALGCALSALKQIDAIVIESSSFTVIRGDAYRLNLTVKNSATTEIATPAIELTLTDSKDRPVMRKVLWANSNEPHPSVLATGGEWTTNQVLNVKPAVGAERITGYRVLAFYP